MKVVCEVLSQHAEEVSFLWELRNHAVTAPHYNLADLASLDSRVNANLDGLYMGGDSAWELCTEGLGSGQAGAIFAAAMLALESRDESRLEIVLEASGVSSELSRGFVSALGWSGSQTAKTRIGSLLSSDSPALRRIGIAAAAITHRDPGRALAEALTGADSVLRGRALRAAGELGFEAALPDLRHHMTGGDELSRFWAAWSMAVLSPGAAPLAILQSAAESKQPYQMKALQTAIRRMDHPAAHAWIDRLAGTPDHLRTAIIAAGAFGDPARIPWLVDHMNTPELARVAGEAFTMITGIDLAYNDLERGQPEGFEAGPTEDPADDNVEMDPDEHLPWPDPDLVAKWWHQHRGEFQSGVRYLIGKPIDIPWCEQVLRIGRQRQRAAAALELAMRQPGTPLFNVAAPGFRQQQLLGLRR